jgi:hypothetical protein
MTAYLDLGLCGFSTIPRTLPPAISATPTPLGVRDFLEKNFGSLLLFLKGAHGPGNIIFDQVVPENHADLLPVGKIFCQVQGRGNTPLPFLICIVNMFESEFLSVP